MAYINVDEVYILDNTGLQVDMATDIPFVDAGFTDAQKEQARKNIAAGGTNPNLLDNPFFQVNQRQTTTTSSANAYIADRWVVSGNTYTFTYGRAAVSVTNASSSLAYLFQKLPTEVYDDIDGKTVTYSVKIDGVVHSVSFIWDKTLRNSPITIPSLNDDMRFWYGDQGQPCLQIRVSGTWTINAVKLELGSVSTLANDAPPDYATELAKCQMYLRSIYARSGGTYVGIGMGFSSNSYEIELPFSMRATPTASYSGTIEIYAPSGTHTVSAVSVVSASTDTVELRFTVSGTVTTYENGHIYMANGAKILLSADL